jgi:hypothetical protein
MQCCLWVSIRVYDEIIMSWSCKELLVFVLHLGCYAILNFLPGIDIEAAALESYLCQSLNYVLFSDRTCVIP